MKDGEGTCSVGCGEELGNPRCGSGSCCRAAGGCTLQVASLNYCNLVAGTPSPPAAASHGTPQKCAKNPPAAPSASWSGQERGQEQGWGQAVPAQPGRRSPQTPHETGKFCENIGIYLKRLIRYDFTVPPHIFISYFI